MALYKYPRIKHLPWSPGRARDDLILNNTNHFQGKMVVVSIKMDGENTNLYPHTIHARSTDFLSGHLSRDWIKNLWAKIRYQIPDDWRVCGENLYAKHTIHYLYLPAYFLVFSIWDDKNICLSWPETVKWSKQLGLATVPVIYQGLYQEKLIRNLYTKTYDGDPCEGYVIRLAESFPFYRFHQSVAKYVRESHVQTDKHWLRQPMIKNSLKPL